MEPTPEIAFCPVAAVHTFTPCDPAELQPLLTHLTDATPVSETKAFPRGTLLADGRLDLCKQGIGPAGAKAVAAALRANPFVTAVLLGADGIGDAGAESVAELIETNPNTCTAYLGCNGIGPNGVRTIVEAVSRGAPLAGLWLKRNPIGDEGATIISRLLERNTTIRTLDLVNTEIRAAGLRELCDALAYRNRTVRRVYLGGNGIGAVGAAELAKVIRHSTAINALLLNANQLGDSGAELIASALNENRSLTELGLAANSIGPSGLSDLFAATRHHPTLRRLDVGYCQSALAVGAAENRLGNDGVAAAAELIRADGSLLELDLRRCGLTQNDLPVLADAVEQNSTLCWLHLGVALSQSIKLRLRRVFDRNRAANAPIPSDLDVLAIRSVYRS